MIYAKVNKNNQLELPKIPLIGNGWASIGPTEVQLLSCGYLPVIENTKPVKEGYYHTPYYEQEENEIIQKWKEHEILQPEQSPQDYLWEKLMG